ncbi:methyl-accepting chemotaxis sensory transducer with Cache sensor [Marinitoga hydrogenitolerans DSM 16785]|uniref:Methyl-accepting chemotaxis sensory transducer with Cache sensor n=1 Tax=Marinitoga hydrogenitolerans (strain DSM 16785 / JCM 12826 / AT1271) TaxID=1122195 RepID=A0A1M5ADV8_MARH1|nr:HAMP domain-containing methyl-accepting chemotaxis protein [Marinitoga hydrogenitolerans]SHF28413.1 methyl-accepting chemotaxis sensory transducer with Cache sensor [Marinitoga hydrogenitolerans DSM 16785]
MKLKVKLLLIFILSLSIPFIILGYFALNNSKNALEFEIGSNFSNIMDSKTFELSMILDNCKGSLENITHLQYLPIMLKSMNSYFKDFQDIKNLKDVYVYQNPNPPEERYKLYNVNEDNLEKYGDDEFSIADYDLLHRKYHPNLVNYALSQKLEDIYLLNKDGDIIYTLKKGDEFTENIENDKLKNTALGTLFNKLKEQTDDNITIEFSKIELYNNKPILFIGTPFVYRYARYGYIIISINFQEIGTTIFEKINKDSSTNIYVLNSNNVLITKLKEINPGKKITQIPKTLNTITEYINFKNKEVLGIASEIILNNEKLKIILEKDKNLAYMPINKLKNTLITVIGITLIFAIIITIVFSNNLTTPIKIIEKNALLISEGDLTQKIAINRKDEIGLIANIFNKLKDTIKNIAISFNKYSNILKNAEENLDSTSDELINITNETFNSFEKIKENLEVVASSAEETTANIQEITSGADMLSKSSNDLNQKTKEISFSASAGKTNIQNMINDITNIEKLVEKSNSMISKLFEKTKTIEEIVEKITDISKQTNLLALNAAIEAARAGEAGKGFAVVADEIRKLADESSKSATDITENLNSLVNDASEALNESSSITKNVNQMVESIKEIGNQMENILSEIDIISEMVENTSNISNQQKISTAEITNAIESISVSIQNITEKVENVSIMMSKQKTKLKDFDNLIEGLEKMTNEMIDFSKRFKF